MPITVTCQSCMKSLRIPDSAARRSMRCPACGLPVTAAGRSVQPIVNANSIAPAPAVPKPISEESPWTSISDPVPRRRSRQKGLHPLLIIAACVLILVALAVVGVVAKIIADGRDAAGQAKQQKTPQPNDDKNIGVRTRDAAYLALLRQDLETDAAIASLEEWRDFFDTAYVREASRAWIIATANRGKFDRSTAVGEQASSEYQSLLSPTDDVSKSRIQKDAAKFGVDIQGQIVELAKVQLGIATRLKKDYEDQAKRDHAIRAAARSQLLKGIAEIHKKAIAQTVKELFGEPNDGTGKLGAIVRQNLIVFNERNWDFQKFSENNETTVSVVGRQCADRIREQMKMTREESLMLSKKINPVD